MKPVWLTTYDIARRCAVHPNQVGEWIRLRGLPATITHREGDGVGPKVYRILESDWLAWSEANLHQGVNGIWTTRKPKQSSPKRAIFNRSNDRVRHTRPIRAMVATYCLSQFARDRIIKSLEVYAARAQRGESLFGAAL